jgi:DNA (cytosine-5)-methyltransferase 1
MENRALAGDRGMTRPRLLDLFCCAGGAAMGYYRAGFDVVGVDIRPQPRYPFAFHQGDALEFLRKHGHEFDAIHASPPCQAHTALKTMPNAKHHEDLIPETRELLLAAGKPFVIENVPGAPLRAAFLLCGTMFGLRTSCGAELWRHRYFEINWNIGLVMPCQHREAGKVIGVYGGHGRDRRRVCTVTGNAGGGSNRDGTQQFSTAERRLAMGIDWMTNAELSQAIPPAYTEFIGRQLLAAL